MEREPVDFIKRLARHYSNHSGNLSADNVLAQLLASAKVSEPSAIAYRGASDPSSPPTPPDPLSTVSALARAELERRTEVRPTTTPTIDSSSNQEGSDTGAKVLKTLGLLTGVGPVVTGLLSVFGGRGGRREEATALPVYAPPPSVNVMAGLNADRSVSGVSYGAGGQIRSLSPQGNSTMPVIQVNVQAMDSRSFIDHSADIAAAVRKAMLQSSSLNDIVAEL
jgi:hypothetical protein